MSMIEFPVSGWLFESKAAEEEGAAVFELREIATLIYAGLDARATPKRVWWILQGWCDGRALSTGGAGGAHIAFAKGAPAIAKTGRSSNFESPLSA